MKLHLSVALFFCLFHCSFADVTEEPDDFCDEGPPGKYCLQDLSGWHDCHVDPSTGKIVDKIYSCAPNTRCACFYGPACPGFLDNPCQPYQLPPPTPSKYTMKYKFKETVCSPAGCRDTYYTGRQLQSLTEYKKRDDVYGVYAKFWESVFVLPGNGSSFIQTNVYMDLKQCNSQEIKAFPKTEIPPYFSYNGTVKIGDRLCEQWIWKTGGHNAGQPTSLTAYYITNQTNVGQQRYPAVSGVDAGPFVPVMYEAFGNSGPVGKTSSHLVNNITSFLIGEFDEKLLKLPDFC